jgi:hypothetical protein
VPDTISEVALSAFGARPYRYLPVRQQAKSRAEFDREQDERRSSLAALGNMLSQFLEGAKRGDKDPSKLMEEIARKQNVSQEHKDIMKDLLEEDDSSDDEEAEEHVFKPMHSMHTPDEVNRLLAELESVAPAIRAAKHPDALRDYEEELLPTLRAIAEEGRMLFVQVDT